MTFYSKYLLFCRVKEIKRQHPNSCYMTKFKRILFSQKKNVFFATLLLFTISSKAQDLTVNLIENSYLKEKYLQDIQGVQVYKHHSIEVSDSLVNEVLQRQPYFGVQKENIMSIGTPLNQKPNKSNSNVFFQLSIKHKLTKGLLPYNSFAYITYTQRSFWDIFENSSPFRDNNYNPGIGIAKYFIHKNKLIGAMTVQLEHESNGKDGKDSRSWNYLNISGKYFYNMRTSVKADFIIPFIDGQENKDLLKYRGYANIELNHIDKKNIWWFSAKLRPRDKFINFNTELSVAYKIAPKYNQYLMLSVYNGYGENLLDYKKYSSMIRFGFVIKPDFFNPS